jgi:hypothetical protein
MALLSDWEDEVIATPPPPIEGDYVEICTAGADDEDAITGLLAQLGDSGAYNWTSDNMEADFSVAVELVMESQIYLKILRDLIKRFGVLSLDQEKDFKFHMERIEEFTDQWLKEGA